MLSEPPAAPQSPDASPPESADQPRIGARYVVLEQLGRGGMAVVHRVRDTATSQVVALKQLLLHGDVTRDRETTALFEREFYTLAQLKHPSVIEVYDYGVAGAGPYYTMELLDGGDLSARVPLPYREACELMIQVCSSLSLLHSRRLLHRDISPRNVRCTQAGKAKLIDFGAMVPIGTSGPSVGTPAFIAPEVLHQLALDARADLFSLGATLYYALTGRPPFPVRTFSELRKAWNHEPAPPGQLVAGIPPALDALLFSMLSIDPASRPRSAFEVMQRLAAIAGTTVVESDAISQAYLATPALVARDAEQQRIRSRLRRALTGQGGALSIESAAGDGRSRLLDACVLDAKTLGTTVLRVSGRAGQARPFEGAQTITNQLIDVLPELAQRCARESGELLFVTEGDKLRLRALREIAAEREVIQAALTQFLAQAGREQPLLIAADDVERIDEASLALLASLALGSPRSRLVVAITLQSPVTPGALPALDVLRAQCTVVSLSPFTPGQTQEFFAALFGQVPQIALVADRIFKVAAGNPRESMALAQYLLDRKLIRYADGQWILPAELSVSDLPANAEAALQTRVAELPPLARRLAEAQALSLTYQSAWSRADHADFVDPSDHAGIDAALDALLQKGIVVSDGHVYTLASHTVRSCLVQQLSAADRARQHEALAELSIRQRGSAGLNTVHHWLHAGLHEQALDQLTVLLASYTERVDFEEARMSVHELSDQNERAHALTLASGRPPREAFDLARHQLSLSVALDASLYERHAPALLAQLERDSGLAAYRACPESMPANERLQTALTAAMAQYNATPERDRVYRVDEAIKYIARFATVSIVIGVRGRDSSLLASLPGMLEPFAGFSPVLHALWQNLISATEMNYKAQPLKARARARAVYDSLATASGEDLRYVDTIRHAVSYALSVIEMSLGYPSANDWVAKLDSDPLQQVNAMRLRSFQCLYAGDIEESERFRTKAEILAVQAASRQMFDSPIVVELGAQLHAADLSGLKRTSERIALRAAKEPRWRAAAWLAQGLYERLRGDFEAAHAAFVQCIALDNPSRTDAPPWLDTWRMAAAGEIASLVELGRAAEARSFGEAALEQALQLGLGPWAHEIARELALAEAKAGDIDRAITRLDRLIAERADVLPAHLAADYEARTCVAIWAKDTAGVAKFAALAVRHDRVGRHATLLLRKGRLLDEARAAGIDFAMLPTGFESAVLGEASGPVRRATKTKVTAALHMHDPSARAQRALELLCETAGASSGHMYLFRDAKLERAASVGSAAADSTLDLRVDDYWARQLHEQLDDDFVTQSGSGTTELNVTSFLDPKGTYYQLLLLKSMAEGSLRYVGVVALVASEHEWPALYWELASDVGTRLMELGDVTGVAAD